MRETVPAGMMTGTVARVGLLADISIGAGKVADGPESGVTPRLLGAMPVKSSQRFSRYVNSTGRSNQVRQSD